MPITTSVGSTGSGSGVDVSGDVEDVPVGGGGDQDVEVIVAIDASQVSYISATPTPYMKSTSGDHIKLWWKLTLESKSTWPFTVKLKCKPGASGPTTVGLAACSQATVPSSKHRFHATTHTIYHGHTCGRRPRPLLRKRGRSRKK